MRIMVHFLTINVSAYVSLTAGYFNIMGVRYALSKGIQNEETPSVECQNLEGMDHKKG